MCGGKLEQAVEGGEDAPRAVHASVNRATSMRAGLLRLSRKDAVPPIRSTEGWTVVAVSDGLHTFQHRDDADLRRAMEGAARAVREELGYRIGLAEKEMYEAAAGGSGANAGGEGGDAGGEGGRDGGRGGRRGRRGGRRGVGESGEGVTAALSGGR